MASEQQKALIGWAKTHMDFAPDLKVQKFLFFYECLSKIAGDAYDFSDLKGYRRGPVFASVYAENKYDTGRFHAQCMEAAQNVAINEARAKQALFLAQMLGKGLSDFTHSLNIWAAKEKRILSGEQQVSLDDSDFSENDAQVFRRFQQAYPVEYIDSVDVKERFGKTFILPKGLNLSDNQWEALSEIADDPELKNPVYVDVDEDGGLLVE